MYLRPKHITFSSFKKTDLNWQILLQTHFCTSSTYFIHFCAVSKLKPLYYLNLVGSGSFFQIYNNILLVKKTHLMQNKGFFKVNMLHWKDEVVGREVIGHWVMVWCQYWNGFINIFQPTETNLLFNRWTGGLPAHC